MAPGGPYQPQNQGFYDRYYADQVGHGLPVYSGYAQQRGHGLGSILGGLIRGAMPTIKAVGTAVGKHALKTGMRVASDVAGGDGVKRSLKRRAMQGAAELLNRGAIKRRKTTSKTRRRRVSGGRRAKIAKKGRKSRQSDFFG